VKSTHLVGLVVVLVVCREKLQKVVVNKFA
jgi:hypothetical protein